MDIGKFLVDTIELSTYIEKAEIPQEHKLMCFDLIAGREPEAADTFFYSLYRDVNPVLFFILAIRRMEEYTEEHYSTGDKLIRLIDHGHEIFKRIGIEGKRLSIVARFNDFYRVLYAAQRDNLLDESFHLIVKRKAKLKLAALIMQMNDHQYFKGKLNGVEVKEKHMIEFCQCMFNANLRDYFHRNANTVKARNLPVYHEILRIELEKKHKL